LGAEEICPGLFFLFGNLWPFGSPELYGLLLASIYRPAEDRGLFGFFEQLLSVKKAMDIFGF
jgi:hypothetical protein